MKRMVAIANRNRSSPIQEIRNDHKGVIGRVSVLVNVALSMADRRFPSIQREFLPVL
jgi:hypothetical protein